MDHVVLYHWWGQGGKVAQNMAFPVILSIATLRAHNKDIPIVVMDLSDSAQDWEDYPNKLNFKVEKLDPFLRIDVERYGFKSTPWPGTGETESKPINLHMMSRPFDYWKCGERQPQNKVLGCDSDIFWLKNPLPLIEEKNGFIPKFVVDGNLGLFYFDKRSDKAQATGKLWMALCLQALYDPSFRKELIEVTPHYPIIIDEMAMNWAIEKKITLPTPTPRYENFHISGFRSYGSINEIETKVKNAHCLYSITGPHRGRFCQVVKEFYDALSSMLSEEDLKDIFGDNYNCEKWSIIDFHKSNDKNGAVTNKMWEFLGHGTDYMTQLDGDFKATHKLIRDSKLKKIKII
jgi:hypothetical protein